MAYIAFTDGTGAPTLNNGRTAPANRFKDWTPDAEPIHDVAVPPSTGAIQRWLYRTDYFASFEVDKLPTSMLAVAVRLKLHLMGGGSVTVETGDASDTAYTCTLKVQASTGGIAWGYWMGYNHLRLWSPGIIPR